jgi:hypothetical protein
LTDSSEAKTVGEPARKSDIKAGKIRWGIGDDTSFPSHGYVSLAVVVGRTLECRCFNEIRRLPRDLLK